MKELRELQGGYPRAANYHLNAQTEYLTALNAVYAKLGFDLVLAGCEVTDHGNDTISIAPGVVFVSGEVLRFDGSNNVANDGSKALVKGAYVTTDPVTFADQQNKDLYKEAKAVVGNTAAASQIVLQVKLRTLKTYIEDLVAGAAFRGEKKVVVDLDGDFLDHFDGSGLGVQAPYLGWALGNGNNNTPNYAGRAGIGYGTYNSPVDGLQINYVAGTPGGADRHRLITPETPSHSHTVNTNAQGGKSDNANDRDVMIPGNSTKSTSSVGGDQPHNNMMPYVVEYVIVKII